MADVKEFRKKPVVIQAIQWDGTLSGMDEILSVFTDIRTVAKTSHPPTNTCSFWKIGTLEGSHEVSAHDFVIRGVKGEYYPCKPDIFFMTYEPATATPPADAVMADASGIRLPTGCVCTTKANDVAAIIDSAIHDAELEQIVEESDARWTEDMFHVHGGELMNMLRKAAALRARGAGAVPEGYSVVPTLILNRMKRAVDDAEKMATEGMNLSGAKVSVEISDIKSMLLAASKGETK